MHATTAGRRGLLNCAAITCCRNLADYERAGQWSAAVTRWGEREACTGFPGLCRIHTGEPTAYPVSTMDFELSLK